MDHEISRISKKKSLKKIFEEFLDSLCHFFYYNEIGENYNDFIIFFNRLTIKIDKSRVEIAKFRTMGITKKEREQIIDKTSYGGLTSCIIDFLNFAMIFSKRIIIETVDDGIYYQNEIIIQSNQHKFNIGRKWKNEKNINLYAPVSTNFHSKNKPDYLTTQIKLLDFDSEFIDKIETHFSRLLIEKYWKLLKDNVNIKFHILNNEDRNYDFSSNYNLPNYYNTNYKRYGILKKISKDSTIKEYCFGFFNSDSIDVVSNRINIIIDGKVEDSIISEKILNFLPKNIKIAGFLELETNGNYIFEKALIHKFIDRELGLLLKEEFEYYGSNLELSNKFSYIDEIHERMNSEELNFFKNNANLERNEFILNNTDFYKILERRQKSLDKFKEISFRISTSKNKEEIETKVLSLLNEFGCVHISEFYEIIQCETTLIDNCLERLVMNSFIHKLKINNYWVFYSTVNDQSLLEIRILKDKNVFVGLLDHFIIMQKRDFLKFIKAGRLGFSYVYCYVVIDYLFKNKIVKKYTFGSNQQYYYLNKYKEKKELFVKYFNEILYQYQKINDISSKRRLIHLYGIISCHDRKLKFNQTELSEIKEIINKIQKFDVVFQGKSYKIIIAAIEFHILKITRPNLSLEKISCILDINKKAINHELSFLVNKKILYHKRRSIHEIITAHLNEFQLNESQKVVTIELLNRILKKLNNTDKIQGKNPFVISAAILYAIFKKNDIKITQSKISSVFNVTEAGFRKYIKGFKNLINKL